VLCNARFSGLELSGGYMKSLEIPKGLEAGIRRKTDNIMANRKSTKRQTMTYKMLHKA